MTIFQYAKLSVTSVTRSANSISEIIGLDPDESHDLGDLRANAPPYRRTHWILVSNNPQHRAEELISSLLRRVAGAKAGFLRLAETKSCDVELSLVRKFSASGLRNAASEEKQSGRLTRFSGQDEALGVHVSVTDLVLMAELGVELDIDEYVIP